MPSSSKRSTRNWESDRVRPELIAFRELDTLVRNLTDQLAGYRRRALAAESRTRELEQDVARLTTELDEANIAASAAAESRDHALSAAREATASARAARASLAELEQTAAAQAAEAASAEVFPQPTSRETERLKEKLAEAKERTAQLADRVRFLRQQLMHGSEK